MNYSQIYKKEELDILRDKKAFYEDLEFSFSEKYLDFLKQLLEEKNALQLLVTDEKENFVGYLAAAERLWPDFLWVAELFIDPSSQGRGIGTALLKKVIEEAQQKGLRGVITQTEFKNIPARELYKKVGFVEVDNPGWKDGVTLQIIFGKK